MGGTSKAKTEARRAFLINCAKFAAAAPPAITLLLAAGETEGQSQTPACSQALCDLNDPPMRCDCEDATSSGFVAPNTAEDPDLNTN